MSGIKWKFEGHTFYTTNSLELLFETEYLRVFFLKSDEKGLGWPMIREGNTNHFFSVEGEYHDDTKRDISKTVFVRKEQKDFIRNVIENNLDDITDAFVMHRI